MNEKQLTYTDRARKVIAEFEAMEPGAEFTTAWLQIQLDGYRYAASITQYLCASGEIERTDEESGSGNYATFRATGKLKKVSGRKQCAAVQAAPMPKKEFKSPANRAAPIYPLSEEERQLRISADRLQKVLDGITRRNREACYA